MIQLLEERCLLALVVAVDKGVLLVQGTRGPDQITIDQTDTAIVVTINESTFTTPLKGIKSLKIWGDAGNDLITLTPVVAKPAEVRGGAGDDTLVGPDFPCTLLGEAGNDTLRGGAAGDVLAGGPGIDTADYSLRSSSLRISLDGKANDGAMAGPGGRPERDNVGNDVEIVRGGSGNDQITGNKWANTLVGGAGDDSLYGGAGNDVLSGGDGADLLSGGPDDDLLIAVDLDARDSLDGGDGQDSYIIDRVGDITDSLLNVEVELAVVTSPGAV
jgi:Ca2+-binding RTX toxin-like protein